MPNNSHRIMNAKQEGALRPGELQAYAFPYRFEARNFLGSCEWEKFSFATYEEAVRKAQELKNNGGRPSVYAIGRMKTGEDCVCLVPVDIRKTGPSNN